MKKICLFLLFLLITSCSTIDTLEEIGVDNKRCIGIRRFKVLQAVYHNTGLAFECFTPDCSDAYRNNLDFILGDKVSEDLYDGMIYADELFLKITITPSEPKRFAYPHSCSKEDSKQRAKSAISF